MAVTLWQGGHNLLALCLGDSCRLTLSLSQNSRRPTSTSAWLLANQHLFKIQVTGYRPLSHTTDAHLHMFNMETIVFKIVSDKESSDLERQLYTEPYIWLSFLPDKNFI